MILVVTAGLAASPAAAISLTEIQGLLVAGMDETTIRAQIRAEGSTFLVEASDLLALHEAGASGDFLQFLIGRKTVTPNRYGKYDPWDEERSFGESGDRFYLKVRDNGSLVYVFTNLDGDGNRLPEIDSDLNLSLIASGGPAESSPIRSASGPEVPEYLEYGESIPVAGPSTQVIVVQPPTPPAPAYAPPPYYGGYPGAFAGGIVGPYRYPERLNFLGYGAGNDFPIWFTGMGMKSAYGKSLDRAQHHSHPGAKTRHR